MAARKARTEALTKLAGKTKRLNDVCSFAQPNARTLKIKIEDIKAFLQPCEDAHVKVQVEEKDEERLREINEEFDAAFAEADEVIAHAEEALENLEAETSTGSISDQQRREIANSRIDKVKEILENRYKMIEEGVDN